MASYLETATSIAREAGSLLLQFAERRPAFELPPTAPANN